MSSTNNSTSMGRMPERSDSGSLRRRNWILLLILGLLLNILVSFTSELGLDTHVHMSRNTSDNSNLPWGHTRPIDPMANDPSYSPSEEVGWHRFLPDSENSVHLLGFSFMILLLICTLFLFKVEGSLDQGIAVASIVAINPDSIDMEFFSILTSAPSDRACRTIASKI